CGTLILILTVAKRSRFSKVAAPAPPKGSGGGADSGPVDGAVIIPVVLKAGSAVGAPRPTRRQGLTRSGIPACRSPRAAPGRAPDRGRAGRAGRGARRERW